jgi:undecaprenyl phosphate-alpha-L-ara4N flippase subunit ArnE
MNATLGPVAIGLLAFCIAAETVQQLSFKVGADRAGRSANFLQGALAQPWIWLGVGIWIVESIAWLLVLQHTPLSLAYPVMTLSYAAVPLAGVVFLRERMSRRQAAGAALILAGVVFVAMSGL